MTKRYMSPVDTRVDSGVTKRARYISPPTTTPEPTAGPITGPITGPTVAPTFHRSVSNNAATASVPPTPTTPRTHGHVRPDEHRHRHHMSLIQSITSDPIDRLTQLYEPIPDYVTARFDTDPQRSWYRIVIWHYNLFCVTTPLRGHLCRLIFSYTFKDYSISPLDTTSILPKSILPIHTSIYNELVHNRSLHSYIDLNITNTPVDDDVKKTSCSSVERINQLDLQMFDVTSHVYNAFQYVPEYDNAIHAPCELSVVVADVVRRILLQFKMTYFPIIMDLEWTQVGCVMKSLLDNCIPSEWKRTTLSLRRAWTEGYYATEEHGDEWTIPARSLSPIVLLSTIMYKFGLPPRSSSYVETELMAYMTSIMYSIRMFRPLLVKALLITMRSHALSYMSKSVKKSVLMTGHRPYPWITAWVPIILQHSRVRAALTPFLHGANRTNSDLLKKNVWQWLKWFSDSTDCRMSIENMIRTHHWERQTLVDDQWFGYNHLLMIYEALMS